MTSDELADYYSRDRIIKEGIKNGWTAKGFSDVLLSSAYAIAAEMEKRLRKHSGFIGDDEVKATRAKWKYRGIKKKMLDFVEGLVRASFKD